MAGLAPRTRWPEPRRGPPGRVADPGRAASTGRVPSCIGRTSDPRRAAGPRPVPGPRPDRRLTRRPCSAAPSPTPSEKTCGTGGKCCCLMPLVAEAMRWHEEDCSGVSVWGRWGSCGDPGWGGRPRVGRRAWRPPGRPPTGPSTPPGPWERRSGKVPGVQAGPGGLAHPRVPPGRPRSFRERVGFQSNAHFPSARSTGNLRAHGRTAHEGRRAGGRRTDRLPQRAGPGSPVSHGETNPSPLSAGGPVL